MSLYTGKLMFIKIECGCIYEGLLYFFGGYNKESLHRFIICSSCASKEKTMSEDKVESKENEIMEKLWEDELQEPGTTDDEWFRANLALCF